MSHALARSLCLIAIATLILAPATSTPPLWTLLPGLGSSVVLYATCSPVVTETVDVVRATLAGRDDVRLEDAAPLLPEAEDATCVGLPEAVQLWPHRHATDAMFLALLRKS